MLKVLLLPKAIHSSNRMVNPLKFGWSLRADINFTSIAQGAIH